MIIALDCDEVLLDYSGAAREFYLSEIDPTAEIPHGTYASRWPVWKGSVEESKRQMLSFLADFAQSERFMRMRPLDGAVEGVKDLRALGHKLSVLSAVSDDPMVTLRRTEVLGRIVGKDIFSDVVCVKPFTSKKEWLLKLDADALVDDSTSNITQALQIGIYGLLNKCPSSAPFIDAIYSGQNFAELHGDTNFQLIRDKAMVVNGWTGMGHTIGSSIDIIHRIKATVGTKRLYTLRSVRG